MRELTFFIADVFARKKYEGNQLAVFRNAGCLTDDEMQKIAKEINFSETTFILSDEERNGSFDVRIFTPGCEVPFAGHPTLGTAYIIQKKILKEPRDKVLLNLKAGVIPVTFSKDEILWMKQNKPEFKETYSSEEILKVLNLEKDDIDMRYPVEAVTTGLAHIIVPLKTLKANQRININRDEYFRLIYKTEAKSILTFCPETYDKANQLNVRVFDYYYGIPEDPATGSGNGCLAGYLLKHNYFGKNEISLKTEQGMEIGRPSQLFLKGYMNNSEIEINVGGHVILMAQGAFC